mgnify:CR=1 FL=1
MIAIVNYGIGNVNSVIKAFQLFSNEIEFTDDPEKIRKSKAIVLPGVSSFGAAMEELEKRNLVQLLKDEIAKGKIFFGICVGIQLLFEESEETPGIKGLSIFKGKVKKFEDTYYSVPQIGWNQISIIKRDNPILKNINNDYFYFVHSYYVEPEDKEIIASTTDYGVVYPSTIWHKNIFAVQFHPEKSQNIGLKLLKNFVQFVYNNNG